MTTLDNGKIIVKSLMELRIIVEKKEIPLELIDIKESGLISLYGLFYNIKEINGSINNWDVSCIKDMTHTFANSKINCDISSWKFNKYVSCYEMFLNNISFEEKYNSNEKIPRLSHLFLEWFEEKREKMREMNLSNDKILDFFSFDNDINLNKDS